MLLVLPVVAAVLLDGRTVVGNVAAIGTNVGLIALELCAVPCEISFVARDGRRVARPLIPVKLCFVSSGVGVLLFDHSLVLLDVLLVVFDVSPGRTLAREGKRAGQYQHAKDSHTFLQHLVPPEDENCSVYAD